MLRTLSRRIFLYNLSFTTRWSKHFFRYFNKIPTFLNIANKIYINFSLFVVSPISPFTFTFKKQHINSNSFRIRFKTELPSIFNLRSNEDSRVNPKYDDHTVITFSTAEHVIPPPLPRYRAHLVWAIKSEIRGGGKLGEGWGWKSPRESVIRSGKLRLTNRMWRGNRGPPRSRS